MKILLTGGAVRDKLLGIKSNDLDYVMVLDDINLSLEEGYDVMKDYMLKEGFSIFLETPSMVTIRARFPRGSKNAGITADFVLARRECGYEEGTRRPILELGTLYDDLARRDLTINAMAEDEDGNIIDFFNGKKDLEDRILRTPLDSNITLLDDSLRLLRCLRFCVTKDFFISNEISKAMSNPEVLLRLEKVVSEERIREEILKMFKHDTIKTLEVLNYVDKNCCKGILEICFGKNMWLKPTFEKR